MSERGERWKQAAKKYRYAAALLVLGAVLMLLPGGVREGESVSAEPESERFDRTAVQRRWRRSCAALMGSARSA